MSVVVVAFRLCSADGSADVTFGCNRMIFSFYNLPATNAVCAGGGCFPVVSVYGSASVQVLPILPQFTLQVVKFVNCRRVIADLVENPAGDAPVVQTGPSAAPSAAVPTDSGSAASLGTATFGIEDPDEVTAAVV